MTLSFPSFARVACANAACALILALLANTVAAEDATAPATSDATAPATATAPAPAGEATGKKQRKPAPETANGDIGKLAMWANLLDAKEGDPKAEARWNKFEDNLKKRPDDFNAMDADKDGKISKDELQAAFDKLSGDLKDKFPDDFAKVDTDKNGALSKAELNAYLNAMRKAAKEKRDAEKAAKEAASATGAAPAPAGGDSASAPAPAGGDSATPAATK
jgi:hypothetical protein